MTLWRQGDRIGSMKTVKLRDFQRQASIFLNDLPIVLTSKNVPVAIVHPLENKVGENGEWVVSEKEPISQDNMPLKAEKEIVEHLSEKAPEHGWCEEHFERGVEYPLKEISYEDIDGVIVWKKKICPKCIKKLESDIKLNGGKIHGA